MWTRGKWRENCGLERHRGVFVWETSNWYWKWYEWVDCVRGSVCEFKKWLAWESDHTHIILWGIKWDSGTYMCGSVGSPESHYVVL